VPGVGQAAGEGPLGERLVDARAEQHPAERDVAGVDPLGERDDVRHHAPPVDREPLAAPGEPAHHLVADEQHAVPVAQLAHPGEVAVGRHQDAVGAHDGLQHDRGDRVRAFEREHLFEVRECPLALLLGVLGVERGAIGIRAEEAHDTGDARLVGPAPRVTGQRDGA
jgi:hypothetical protein